MTLRIGFYGAGLISQLHCYLLANCSVAHEIVAVHDPDTTRASAFAAAHGATAVAEDDLLDQVDAVYITTWTSEHQRLVDKAARRGVAIFCEKPLAFDSATVEEMVATVESTGIVNQVGLLLRAAPTFIQLGRLISDPRAGRVLAVMFRDDQHIPNQGRYASTWRTDASRAGRGALLEHSIHDVDILRHLLGPVEVVSGVVREIHGYPRIDDVAVARLEFAGGAIATLTSVWHDVLERPSMRFVEVFCERMHAAIDDDFVGPVRWQYTGEDSQYLDGHDLVAACMKLPESADRHTTGFLGGSVFNTASTFLSAVRDGVPASPTFSDALVAHRLVDAIYTSAGEGGRPIGEPEARCR